jgi:hypothetical protein
MKPILLAGIAALSLTASAVIAQEAPAPASQPPGTEAAPVPASPPPGADPNAGVPTGAVPADPGMAPAPADAPRDPAAPVGSSANPVTVGGNVTPPPATPQDYPKCSKTVQDSCINPGEAKRSKKPG